MTYRQAQQLWAEVLGMDTDLHDADAEDSTGPDLVCNLFDRFGDGPVNLTTDESAALVAFRDRYTKENN